MNWFVELPPETQAQIGVVAMIVLNLAFSLVVQYVPWLGDFINRYKEEWAAGITLWLVTLIQNMLPEAYPNVSILGVQFVVALILAMLAKYWLRKAGWKI
jgi:hypothetical protein